MVARYYRKVFTKPFLGIPAWFQTHRAGMIITVLVSAVAIIVMFAYLKAWTEYATIHAVIGLVCMGLSLLMILSGFLRPSLDSEIRPVFNWGHRMTGILTWILAVVACILGANTSFLLPF